VKLSQYENINITANENGVSWRNVNGVACLFSRETHRLNKLKIIYQSFRKLSQKISVMAFERNGEKGNAIYHAMYHQCL